MNIHVPLRAADDSEQTVRGGLAHLQPAGYAPSSLTHMHIHAAGRRVALQRGRGTPPARGQAKARLKTRL